MKTRSGFVTNSSTTCFIVINQTSEEKTFKEFFKEETRFLDCYNHHMRNWKGHVIVNIEDFLKDVENIIIPAWGMSGIDFSESNYDHHYAISWSKRHEGATKNFKWLITEYHQWRRIDNEPIYGDD